MNSDHPQHALLNEYISMKSTKDFKNKNKHPIKQRDSTTLQKQKKARQ